MTKSKKENHATEKASGAVAVRYILVRAGFDKISCPFTAGELVICDGDDNVKVFDNIDDADNYREIHGISSKIVAI